jgi:hypothetical protein
MQALPASPTAVREQALDLHEGIRDPQASGCRRWPEHLRLLNHSTGELVPGRCKATNLCRYCARLFAIETSEMLLLDAMEDAPTLYFVLTAREHLTRAECTDHLRQLRKALRKRWPDVRWAVLVEFQKRGALHLNLLVKGVPVDELDELHAAVCDLWCSRVDAEPAGQWSGVIADELGVVKYVTLHFMKSAQAPVLGWRGHRYSSTRDYLVRPAAQMRQEARRSLRLKRLLHAGHDLETAELELATGTTWTLRQLGRLTDSASAATRGQRVPPSPPRHQARAYLNRGPTPATPPGGGAPRSGAAPRQAGSTTTS